MGSQTSKITTTEPPVVVENNSGLHFLELHAPSNGVPLYAVAAFLFTLAIMYFIYRCVTKCTVCCNPACCAGCVACCKRRTSHDDDPEDIPPREQPQEAMANHVYLDHNYAQGHHEMEMRQHPWYHFLWHTNAAAHAVQAATQHWPIHAVNQHHMPQPPDGQHHQDPPRDEEDSEPEDSNQRYDPRFPRI